jgi:hypothetical protein
MPPSTQQHFDGRAPVVRKIYDRLLVATRAMGPVIEDPKKTSIHLARRTAFAGVQTRKDALILTLKASRDISSPRIIKHEQASANRWHLNIRLTTPSEVDAQLIGWLEQAFALAE